MGHAQRRVRAVVRAGPPRQKRRHVRHDGRIEPRDVGVAFLLHEIAHKVVAIEHGQIAEFRADYQMLFLALMGALVGFLFAAPGAVYHRGR